MCLMSTHFSQAFKTAENYYRLILSNISHREGSVSSPGHSMWGLWWPKWQWNRFLSGNTLVFPSVLLHRCTTHSYLIHPPPTLHEICKWQRRSVKHFSPSLSLFLMTRLIWYLLPLSVLCHESKETSYTFSYRWNTLRFGHCCLIFHV